uniref:zinc-ribbon domain-containing protein n=1 Tax=Butyrivibrio sp. TaxID=28121 RepID=UPI0025DEA2BF
MKCPNCGTELKDGTLFCPKCGANLSNTKAPTSTGTAPYGSTDKKKSGSKAILGVISLVAVLAIVVAGVFLYIKIRPVTIDLSKYVSVEYSGYDSYGS